MTREKTAASLPGLLMLILLIAVILGSSFLFVRAAQATEIPKMAAIAIVATLAILCLPGLAVVNPNEALVVQLLGTYKGTLRSPGFHWVNPLTAASRRRVSLRVRNFESSKLKVNDHDGNPIEIAAVVVWKVVDSAEAVFEVDDYRNFVQVQSESALRNLATSHPYDSHIEGEMALRSHTSEIAEQLKQEIQERLSKAGVEVLESRISHLAYASEIASAMLQRQQAGAIIAARTKIVEGAVTMVEMALEQLSRKQIVTLDEERKAAMVSNLLVVLCSDRHAQPVVNAGSLYQ